MSATLNHYIFNAPEHKIRDLLVVMCNNDPYVQDCTRHWIKSIRQETLLRAQEEHAFAAAAPGYYNNNSINETIIANNTTINGTIITNNNNNINGTSNVSVCNGGLGWNINSSSSIRTTSHNGASVQMQNRNQVTVNGNMMPIPNGPPQPQNMKRKGMEERPAPPGPKRVAMGTGVSERVPERRQVRESVVKREPVPEVKRESMPVVKAEYPETRIAAQRKVRIKTESREPTPPTAVPAPVPSPPHRKVRIKTEPTIITDSVRVCDMCEKRYREIGNTDKSCRHHPGYLDLDDRSDEWMDWYHEDGDLPDTDEGRRAYPRGFEWTCCRRDGTGRPCTVSRHVPRAAGLEPRRRPNAMILARDREGELKRVRAVDWREGV